MLFAVTPLFYNTPLDHHLKFLRTGTVQTVLFQHETSSATYVSALFWQDLISEWARNRTNTNRLLSLPDIRHQKTILLVLVSVENDY